MIEFRDLGAQYEALQAQIDEAVAKTIRDRRFVSGPQVHDLEERLARATGTKHCITCGNGTDALLLALMAWNIGPGDAVFVPDFTFFSSGEVVSAVGATPVFVDVDRQTYNIDPRKLEEAISSLGAAHALRPAAVITVDLFGLPADYTAIKPICEERGLLLLEDGAQGFGGSINGELACSFGDISTTSFFPAKPLGCYGDGGAIFTDDDDWAQLIRSYAVHGKGIFKYDNVRIGMNSRLDTIQAAIVLAKLDAFFGSEVPAVNEAARWYDRALAGSDVALPTVPSGYISSWAQYTIQLPETTNREALQAKLREQGIPTMVYYPKPMHEQRAFEGLCITTPNGTPVTQQLCKTVLSLPMGPYLSKDDAHVVAHAIKDALASTRV